LSWQKQTADYYTIEDLGKISTVPETVEAKIRTGEYSNATQPDLEIPQHFFPKQNPSPETKSEKLVNEIIVIKYTNSVRQLA